MPFGQLRKLVGGQLAYTSETSAQSIGWPGSSWFVSTARVLKTTNGEMLLKIDIVHKIIRGGVPYSGIFDAPRMSSDPYSRRSFSLRTINGLSQ